jgi:hypothetical protein
MAKLDEALHHAFRYLRGVSPDWARHEDESLDVILSKQREKK